LVIVDIRMPPTRSMEGLEAAAVIREELPEIAILILSAHVEIAHAMTLLANGSRSGYLLKSRVTDIDEFLDTLERVCRGGSVVDPSLVQQLVVGRDEDHPRGVAVDVVGETASEIETAVGAKVDVDERDLRPQLPNAPHRLRGRARASDNREALNLEQFTRSFAEPRVVVDDEA